MEKSTVLQKTSRIRICDKTKLANLVNHILRNYKPETIQYKRDFNADDTKLNLVIGPDFKVIKKGADWFNKVQTESQALKDTLQQSLIEADEMAEQNISLSRQQKDLTLKSITYFSKLKNYDENTESHLLEIMTQCLDVKNQSKNEKDYSVIDQDSLKTALEFYENPPENIKIKGLNAKKKHLTQILETVDKMQVHNDRRATASTRSIGFEDVLFKIPKHNDKSLKDVDMIKIMRDWNNEYFGDFAILGGALHKDERTKKGNAVDDHLHLIRSGFNRSTKRFDLPDYTHQLGLRLAQEQGIPFEPDGKKYNETNEILRTVASEALQTEFYEFANKKLAKYGYEFRFEKKELTPEEKELRAFLKEQSNLPKSQRVQNLHSYMEEQAKAEQKKRNDHVLITNKAIAKKKTVDSKITTKNEELTGINNNIISSTEKLDKVNKQLENNQKWLYNIIKSNAVQKRIEMIRELTNHSMDFYKSVKKFIKGINQQNDEYIQDLEKENPVWYKQEQERLKREEELKQERIKNRHSGNEYVEEVRKEIKEESKSEIKFDDEPKQKKKKRFGFGKK
ncbi:hypothetical protein VB525_19625 [Vibrio parahaemolyticus]|uniref:hypothetical protein n=1 Tax=Vibrio parahaemolyticus TaxID=670 RepID=UPI002B203427|nr:hypothetical protein [Vibrio parahaemolyticus]MEA5316081.1 hypothetical protein [Vibrio parahaemolyticus]